MTTNQYKLRNQARRGALLANTLRSLGATAADAAALPDEARRMAEQVTGISTASADTWEIAIGILASQEAERAHRAARYVADESSFGGCLLTGAARVA
jgi:hypothetical protein